MTTLTMKDVAPFFAAYEARFGNKCTLSMDVMEEIMSTSDSEDVMLNDMHEAMTSVDDAADVPDYRKRFPKETAKYSDKQLSDLIMATEDDMDDADWRSYFETGTMNDDRLHVAATVDQTAGSAYSYAIRLDAAFEKDIETLAQAAIDNKRGGAVIMLDLFRIFGEDTVCNVWPVPGSEKGKVGDNQAFDRQETSVTKADGTTGKGVSSFYQDIVDLSARGNALLKEKEALKASVGDVKGYKPKMSAIDTKRSSFKSAIVRAVNLAQKMAFVNANTGMNATLIFDDDGKTVVQSNKLLFIQNKSDNSKFDVITIGQFLALKVTEGATYSAIVGTTQRKTKAGTGPQENVVPEVNSLDTFDKVTAAYATFFDKMNEALSKKDMKAYNALLTRLNAAGSDDLLLSLNLIMNSIEGILSKPGIDKRLGALIADGGKVEAKAA